MTKILKFIKLIRVAMLWQKARDMLISRQYNNAFEYLSRIGYILDIDIPSSKVHFKINLLLALAALRLKKYELSFSAAMIVIDEMKLKSKSLTNEERTYIIYYAYIIVSDCDINKTKYLSAVIGDDVKKDFDNLDITKVRKDIIRNFPL